MTNIATALKSEIARLARKEVRAEVTPLKKAAGQYRSAVAALKRQIQSLEKQLRRTRKEATRPEQEDAGAEVRHRFQAKGLATHRRKLGISAEDYGRLVGVTGQSIYKWERGGSHPRAAQVQALAGVRGIGKREALARLEQLSKEALTQKKRAPRKTKV